MESKPKQPVQPAPKPAPLAQDIYPELTSLTISPKTAAFMRQRGGNPTQELQKFEQAHKSKNYQQKAEIAYRLASLTDAIEGGNAAQNHLESFRLPTQAEATPRYNSVSAKQAIGGTFYNGLLDMVEGVSKLPVIGAGLSRMIDGDQFNRATKGIEKVIDGARAYVSEDWKKPIASYDPTDGLQFNLDVKSITGTLSSVGAFMAPGLLTGGMASIATMGERAGLKAVTTAAKATDITQKLGKAGKTVAYLTGAEAFFQTMPQYAREAQKNGLDVYDAHLFGLLVGGINSVIETASVGPLTKALGISEKAAKKTIREVGASEAVDALQKLTGPLAPDMLVDAVQSATKNTLGIISKPEEMKAAAKFFSGVGSRLKNGFLEQGLPEAGEEFLQSIVENSSKQIYNNLAASDTSGRFKDPTWQQYVFDAVYGGSLGMFLGAAPGVFFQSKQADPTVFGYVAANTRQGLLKGLNVADLINPDPQNPARLKILGVLDHKLETGEIDEQAHADLTQKVGRMAGIAADFATVDGFSEKDRHTMFSISEAQFQSDASASTINQAKAAYQEVSQAAASPDLSMGEQIKAQIRQGELEKQLGGLVDTPNGPAFQAEVRQQERTAAIANIKAQAMRQYADDTARPAINAYVSEHVDKINTDYGVTSYADTFKPAKVVTDPNTGQVVVSDGSKLVFRNLTRSGGSILQSAVVDENGVYTPSVREQQTDTYSEPIADLNAHIGLATALADRNNPLEATDYTRPDNSVEASWIADGQQLVQDLQTLTASKAKGKKAALAETQQTALAYLNSSGFLLDNPKYASAYSDVVNALQPSVGELFAQQEQNATPAGGEVDLLASQNPTIIPDQEYADFIDNNAVSPDRIAAIARKIISGEAIADPREQAMFNAKTAEVEAVLQQTQPAPSDVTNTPTPASIIPARLATPAKQSPTVYDEYAAELQRADSEEQRQQSGAVLQQATESLAESAGTPVGVDQSAISRLLGDLDSANNALEQELANYATPATEQPTDESTAGARPKTLTAIWQESLTPEQQQQSAQLASDYLAIDSGQAFSDTERRIADNPPVIANLQDSFTRIAGSAFWQPIIQAKYGAKADNASAPTLDQYAAEIGVTEQDVVDFITSYPAGVDQLYSKARAGIREQFRAITGKEINKLSAQNVLAWASAQPVVQPVGVEDLNESDLSEARELLAALPEEDQAYLAGLIDNYTQQYGDDWLTKLHEDDRAGQLLVELPQSVSDYITKVVSDAIFANNQQQLANVSRYLAANLVRREQAPIPDYTPAGESDGVGIGSNDRQSQESSQSNSGPERPTAPSLAGAADAIRSQSETEPVSADAGVVDGVSNEVEAQLAEDLAPATPVAAPFNEAGQTTYFARSADVPNGFSVESLSATPSRTPLYEILPVSENEAEYRLVPTESARQLAMSDPYSYLDAVEGYGGLSEDDVFVTTQNGRLARNGDSWVITQKAQVRNVSPENVPTFQLNQSETTDVQPELKAFTDRIASAFGISIVTDPAQYQRALADSKSLERTGGREPIAFRYKNVVYLSPNANGSSLLHEAAGIWAEGIRKSDPALFSKGVSLVKQSKYYQQLLRDPYYRTLPQAELEIEALETAIGDKGVQFATEGRKSAFRQFLDELWGKIKSLLGVDAGVDLENMTLSDFVQESVGQILSGDTQVEASVDSDGVQFQLGPNGDLLGVMPESINDLRAKAEQYYQNPPAYNSASPGASSRNSPTGVSPDLWTRNRAYTKVDQEFIKEIVKQTGWKLVGPQNVQYVKDAADGVKPYHPNAYYLGDGRVVRLASNQIGSVLTSFAQLYNDPSNRGKVFKLMFGNLGRWANLETFIGWLDDSAGTLKALITDVRRDTQRNADYVDNKLQPLLEDLKAKMAPFSVGWQGAADVPRVKIQTYDVANGTIIQREVNLPIAEAMAIVRQVETQKSSKYASTTTIWDHAPSASQLMRSNPDGSTTRIPRGSVYYDEQTDQTHYINLDPAQYQELYDRFEGGRGTTQEVAAYQAIKALFNDPTAKQMIEAESKLLRPDEDFVSVSDYYPLDSFRNVDARSQSRRASRTLDENRRLLQRTGPAPALVLRDPLSTASGYMNAVRDVLGSARLVDNLNTLQTQLANDYAGPKKDQILSYLAKISQDLKDHRAKLAEKRAEGGISVTVDALTRRYTNSVFALNVGIPLKQTATYGAAMGQGIIEDIHLRSERALATLARLTAGAYRDTEAPSSVNAQTGRGFTGTLSGAETQDASLLRELMGLDIADPAEREAYQRQAATLIARTTFQQSLYTGDVEWKQTGVGNAATRGGQAIKKLDEWVDTYGLAAMRRADVGVILSYMVAAQEQAKAEGLAENTPEYRKRFAELTEEVVYATNMMGQVSDQTPLQRTTDWVSKLMSLYSGQQQKTLNLVMARLSDWAKTGDAEDLKKLASAFGYGVVANALWVSLVTAGTSALMALLSGDEPPEDWVEGVGWNFVRNVTGTVPSLGSNAVDYLISQNDTIHGNEDFADIPALETFREGLDALNDTKNFILAEDDQKRDKALDSAIYNITDWAAKIAGAPSPIVRLLREWGTTDKDDTTDN